MIPTPSRPTITQPAGLPAAGLPGNHKPQSVNYTLITALLFVFVIFITACTHKPKQGKTWRELPNVTELSSLKQTEFVPTLESNLTPGNNTVYTPTLLLAWQQVLQELKSTATLNDSNSTGFVQLNNSRSYTGALADSEYTVSSEVADGGIAVRAYFHKTLPFQHQLQVRKDPLLFNNTGKVKAVGMTEYDEAIDHYSHILYYKDDDHFILELVPTETGHRIVLAKGLGDFTTLTGAVEQIQTLTEQGEKEMNTPALQWKYEWATTDQFAIPVIGFNIATRYPGLEGQLFYTANNQPHRTVEVYQRTGFILNESGAVAESEGSFSTDSVGGPPSTPHPKNLLFNKAFVLLLKHADQPNPYLVLTVNNTELLKKD